MANPASTLQVANPSMGTVSRQPQTTAQPNAPTAAPFARLSRQGQIFGPSTSGQTYGFLWTPTLKPVGGYVRYFDLNIAQTGGTGTGTYTADGPWNVIQNLFLRDPYGQPIVQADGFSLMLIHCYGGQAGALEKGNNPATMPSFVAGGAPQNFSFSLDIFMELDSSGYCALPSMNAASQPQMQIQTNPIATVQTGVTGSPLLTASVDEAYWMSPVDNPQIAPPDVGSSAQWSVATAAISPAKTAYTRVVLPRVGTFIHTLILVCRDVGAANARVEGWPSADLSFWIDGVPIYMETLAERRDDMFRKFGNVVTTAGTAQVQGTYTGVICYSFRASVQSFVSTADTYDLLLPTTPASLLEVSGTFANAGTGPYSIQAITGELFPVGGIPYTHLAQ